MSLPALATLSDFEDRYGRMLEADETMRVSVLLDDVSALVRDVAGVDWLNDDDDELEDVPGTIVAVVCEVVRRGFDNPAGLAGETIGDYSWRAGKVNYGVYLTTEERRTVRRAAGRLSVGTVGLEGILPIMPSDPRLLNYMNEDGIVVVNGPELDDDE